MNIWLLLLSLLNVILLAGLLFSIFLRVKEKKEDQRLTKGLQLLQNKISILEDLSDRTDEQVHKLVHVIDQKANQVRDQVQIADIKIEQIDIALSKALNISKVLNEQVPHQEMLDRQKTNAYVQAAKMAHEGYSIEQISAKVDLSPAEIEMITKVNKDNLQFSADSLPVWISDSPNNNQATKYQDTDLENFAYALNEQNKKIQQTVKETAFDSIKQDLEAQKNLRSEFNKTVSPIKTLPQTFVEKTITANGTTGEKTIRPMEFRKIISHRN